MKVAFINTLIKEAQHNPKIMLLTGDLGYQIFDEFKEKFGPRYVNVGIAEAQLICAAAGLARDGWRPLTYSIASFMTARCFEQIKLAIAYEKLPVIVVGAGGGYAYGDSGVTHHSGEDFALMSALPGMTVVAPGDIYEVEQLLPQIIKLNAPAYLRIGRGKEPQYHVKAPVILGKARQLSQQGQNIAIISTGDIAYEVVQAVEKLNAEGVFPIAYQFHTIKPLDTLTLKDIADQVHTMIVVEEHISRGGLACAIKSWMVDQKSHPKLISLSSPDEFILGSLSQQEIREKYQFNAEMIIKTVKDNI